MNHAESRLQSEIVAYLRKSGIFVFSVPNDAPGKSHPKTIARLKSMGMVSGVSDLVAITPDGRAVFLEVKTPTGRLSPKQKLFEKKCLDNGWPFYILRSVEDVMEIFET